MDLPYTEIFRAHFNPQRSGNHSGGLTLCTTIAARLITGSAPQNSISAFSSCTKPTSAPVVGSTRSIHMKMIPQGTTAISAKQSTMSNNHSTNLIRTQSSTNLQATSAARLFHIALQAARQENNQDAYEDNVGKKSVSATSTIHGLPGHTRSVHLTPEQWQTLTDYHEHDLFTRTRSWGFCSAIFGIGVVVFGIGSPAWKWIGDKIHSSVICLLGCACLFGLLGLVLAISGVCRTALIPKLYYYHSAGECFLVSNAVTVLALILYPTSAVACIQTLFKHRIIFCSDFIATPLGTEFESNAHMIDHIPQRFAYNYYLTWSASGLFLVSFLCMNLDLLIQSFVKPIPWLSNYISDTVYFCCQTCITYRLRRQGGNLKRNLQYERPLEKRLSPKVEKNNFLLDVKTTNMTNGSVPTVSRQTTRYVPQIRLSHNDSERMDFPIVGKLENNCWKGLINGTPEVIHASTSSCRSDGDSIISTTSPSTSHVLPIFCSMNDDLYHDKNASFEAIQKTYSSYPSFYSKVDEEWI